MRRKEILLLYMQLKKKPSSLTHRQVDVSGVNLSAAVKERC